MNYTTNYWHDKVAEFCDLCLSYNLLIIDKTEHIESIPTHGDAPNDCIFLMCDFKIAHKTSPPHYVPVTLSPTTCGDLKIDVPDGCLSSTDPDNIMEYLFMFAVTANQQHQIKDNNEHEL